MDNKMTEYILKHSRKKDKELKYDFMPSLLEIIERPAHKAGTVIILGVFTLLIAAIVWACLSEIDVVITSSGSIQPVGNLNVVQSYANGSVKAINITEGDYVEKDDVLIELDTQSLDIDAEQLDSQKKILDAQLKIYTKIKDGEKLSEIKIDDYDDELKTYIQSILDNDKSYHNTLDNLEKDKENADLNHQIAQIQLEEYEANGTEREAEMQELMVQQYELAKDQADVKIKDTKTQYSSQVNSKISEISGQLDEIETNLEKYSLSKDYQYITAPVSGHINSINVNTIGAAVTSAQELVTIVPDNTPVEMVCYVKNMDIADVEIGMETEIKLEAYPYNKYGTVKGKVKYISPSAFVSEQMGSVYLVKIEITDKHDDIDIISGLSGSVEIKTDKRTVMDYFLEPIKKGFGESLKEK
ncbi:MAG: HlyD family efflux transporter periplasmic adaptor subunit [Oscillospiraceae bacterium]|uniref:HlyD family efflux transporter periplasmic adaptor subunit n=1 Tax=Porcipelethomonas sp. TaxID=2981675 RepID=UPI000962415F|nr:HlyD family efflux transporter periplasmic adaptor subunit [Oscillospiraceae bacterium]OLA72088.1 MAG: multidrug transporter [Ruminococcus sp. 37_24]